MTFKITFEETKVDITVSLEEKGSKINMEFDSVVDLTKNFNNDIQNLQNQIDNINSKTDLKVDKTDLTGLATETYVNEAITTAITGALEADY